MSLSVVPAIFLAVIFMVSQTDTSNSRSYPSANGRNQVNFTSITKKSNRPETEYKTIYSYIKSKYKKVTEEDATKIAQYLVEYGKKYNLDPKFAAALMARESAFKKDAVSVTGAKGLGQIKDFNYKDLKIKDPFNINQNVSGTTEYLKKMIKKWKKSNKNNKEMENKDESNVKLALASYYKGFTAVTKEGVDEKTEAYVNDIIENYKEIIKHEKN